MIALDTNVLLRHLIGDGEEQAALAHRLIEEELTTADPGFVSIAVLLETIWVLRRGYGYSAQQVVGVVRALLLAPQLVVDQAAVVDKALKAAGTVDLADAIIHELGRRAGCRETVTFDRRFAQHAEVRRLGG